MAMQKITADYIFTGKSKSIIGGTITLDDDARVISVSSNRDKDAKYFYGIICPGIVKCS